MSLKERVYSLLIVSSSDSFIDTFKSLLNDSDYYPCNFVSNISSAKRALLEKSFDLIIINSPLSDGNGANFAIDTSKKMGSVVLLLVKNEFYDVLSDSIIENGAFILPKPLSKSTMITALNWLKSARERLRVNEEKITSISEKMNEIRIVNRAKWILISELKMDEPSAHKYIERQAMDRCVPKLQIANEIISTYS